MTRRIRRWWGDVKLNREARRNVFVVSGLWPARCVIRNQRTGENMIVGPGLGTVAPTADGAANKTTMQVTRGIGSVPATPMRVGDSILKVADAVFSASMLTFLPRPIEQLVGVVLEAPKKVS